MTKSQQVQEITRCGKDPVYFIKNYLKIQHPTKGSIKFDTYPYQDTCVEAFRKHRLNIVLKSRQLGLSTVCAAYALWMAIFHRDKNILVIATKLSVAMNFIKKVTFAIESLPQWLLLPKYEPTKQVITFNNGSCIKAIATSDDAGRSEALSLLIIDEAAFIHNFDEIWTGLSPTFSTGGSAIILSTPNGTGGQYHQLWVEAEAGLNGFNPTKIMWYEHPEHDQKWFENETRNLSKQKLSQEYLCISGDAKVTTPDGYKFVKDIAEGDLVLTHKGRFRRVTTTSSRSVAEEENLYEVSSPGNRKCPFYITGNHPMLSYYVGKSTYKPYVSAEPAWLNADSVADASEKYPNPFINGLFPIFKPEFGDRKEIDLSTILPDSQIVGENEVRYHKQWDNTKRFVPVDFDLGKFVGLYLAEGCRAQGGLDLGFHINEYDTHLAWCRAYLEKFGCRVQDGKHDKHNSCRMWTHNKFFGALVRSFVLGKHAPDKLLDLDLVLSCGVEFVRGLLYGHYLGDGNHSHIKKFTVYSTSSKLIYQLRLLNSIFKLYPRIGKVTFENKNSSDGWYLEFQAENKAYLDLLAEGQQYKKTSRTCLVNDDCFAGRHRLTSITDERKKEVIVYDISVDEDHSFVAESAILHNCDFISSGDTFLQAEVLEVVKNNIITPIAKYGVKRDVWVWADVKDTKTKYVISADVSRGDAHDCSAFHVIDTSCNEVVAEYMGKLPPEKFAPLLIEWGSRYNDALIVPENNTFGYVVCMKIRDAGYRRLYYSSWKGDVFEYIPLRDDEQPGFCTSPKTRPQILAKLEELIRSNNIKLHSQRMYDQLQTFVWNGNRAEASAGALDDLVMALAIGSSFLEAENGGHVSTQKMNMAMAMLQGTGVSKRNMDKAMSVGMAPSIASPMMGRQMPMQGMGRFNMGAHSWLLR